MQPTCDCKHPYDRGAFVRKLATPVKCTVGALDLLPVGSGHWIEQGGIHKDLWGHLPLPHYFLFFFPESLCGLSLCLLHSLLPTHQPAHHNRHPILSLSSFPTPGSFYSVKIWLSCSLWWYPARPSCTVKGLAKGTSFSPCYFIFPYSRQPTYPQPSLLPFLLPAQKLT